MVLKRIDNRVPQGIQLCLVSDHPVFLVGYEKYIFYPFAIGCDFCILQSGCAGLHRHADTGQQSHTVRGNHFHNGPVITFIMGKCHSRGNRKISQLPFLHAGNFSGGFVETGEFLSEYVLDGIGAFPAFDVFAGFFQDNEGVQRVTMFGSDDASIDLMISRAGERGIEIAQLKKERGGIGHKSVDVGAELGMLRTMRLVRQADLMHKMQLDEVQKPIQFGCNGSGSWRGRDALSR